jgi:hypothetical protein
MMRETGRGCISEEVEGKKVRRETCAGVHTPTTCYEYVEERFNEAIDHAQTTQKPSSWRDPSSYLGPRSTGPSKQWNPGRSRVLQNIMENSRLLIPTDIRAASTSLAGLKYQGDLWCIAIEKCDINLSLVLQRASLRRWKEGMDGSDQ